MIYTEEMRASQARVEATRNIRLSEELPRFTAEEKGELLRQYHPDYHEEGFAVLTAGPNKGDKVPKELAALLQGTVHQSRQAGGGVGFLGVRQGIAAQFHAE